MIPPENALVEERGSQTTNTIAAIGVADTSAQAKTYFKNAIGEQYDVHEIDVMD